MCLRMWKEDSKGIAQEQHERTSEYEGDTCQPNSPGFMDSLMPVTDPRNVENIKKGLYYTYRSPDDLLKMQILIH